MIAGVSGLFFGEPQGAPISLLRVGQSREELVKDGFFTLAATEHSVKRRTNVATSKTFFIFFLTSFDSNELVC